MTKRPSVECILYVSSTNDEIDHGLVSSLLGAEPTFTRGLQYTTRSGEESPVRQSLWERELGELVVDSVDTAIHLQLGAFGQRIDAVAALCRDRGWLLDVVQRVRIHDWDDRPYMDLGRQAIQRLHDLNASWGCELVDLSRE